ncbi:hypothetical protein AXG93_412s1050 [Marchantia polymorpha subsp. ruderalis]|uniref:Uncharacterized protein n=1 Tax=Marchantia polymorpha subsp. ruderalis TaxID=1480154 RepID=A0A176VQT2_MARPO|nr:hypothetical protein AXG93_412s1050 [Marchantia polymorpha subsp. ruderalis]
MGRKISGVLLSVFLVKRCTSVRIDSQENMAITFFQCPDTYVMAAVTGYSFVATGEAPVTKFAFTVRDSTDPCRWRVTSNVQADQLAPAPGFPFTILLKSVFSSFCNCNIPKMLEDSIRNETRFLLINKDTWMTSLMVRNFRRLETMVLEISQEHSRTSEEMLADGIRDTGNEEPKSVGKTALIVMISDKGDSLVT